MRTIALSILALISFITLANDRYVGNFPTIKFGKFSVPIDQVCIKNGYVKTIYKIQTCVEWSGEYDKSSCNKNVWKTLRVPIDVDLQTTYKIKYGYYSEGKINPVYTKTYSIADCE